MIYIILPPILLTVALRTKYKYMLDIIGVSRFHNNEFVQYNKDFRDIVNAHSPLVLKIQTQADDYATVVDHISEVFIKERGSDVTPNIIAADLRRDAAISGVSKVADAYAKSHIEDKKIATGIINYIFNKYGKNIGALNYQAETSTVNNLVKDLQTDTKAVAAVTLLGLTDWVIELSSANTAFDVLYLNRNSDYSIRSKDGNIDLRRTVTASQKILIQFINAYAITTPSDDYNKLIDELSSLGRQYKNVLAKRAGILPTPTPIPPVL